MLGKPAAYGCQFQLVQIVEGKYLGFWFLASVKTSIIILNRSVH